MWLALLLFSLRCEAGTGFVGAPKVTVSSSSLPAGSTQYIQNSASAQSGARFAISSGTFVDYLALSSGAAAGKVLTSLDSSGKAVWQTSVSTGMTNPATGALNMNGFSVYGSSSLATTGDLKTTTIGKGVIFTADDGTCHRLHISTQTFGYSLDLTGVSCGD